MNKMTKLDSMYDDFCFMDYNKIDDSVRKYQKAKGKEKEQFKQQLLKAFHKYFLKYAMYFKGVRPDFSSKDTMLFFALFSSGNKFNINTAIDIWKHITAVCREFELEEIYNELVIIFLRALDRFEFVTGVSFVHYVTKYLRWDLKDWVKRQIRNPLLAAASLEDFREEKDGLHYNPVEKNAFFDLNLKWVLNAKDSIFSKLLPYERYLLYLIYKQGLSVDEVSKRLGRAKGTIFTQLHAIYNKLKTIKEEKDD